jgi:acetolactate synthase regulatory subunit
VLDLEEELGALIDALHAANVEYALCGGLALAVHGAPRATIDIDLLVRPDDVERIRQVAASRGFTIKALPMNFAKIRIDRITKIHPDGDTLILDLLVYSPELEEVWETRQRRRWNGRDLSVVSPDGLVTLKMLRRSAQDLADIEALRGMR